jgi:hypothetical protein
MTELSKTPFQRYTQKNPYVKARRIENSEIDYIRATLPTRSKHYSDKDMLEGYVMWLDEEEFTIYKKHIFEAIFCLDDEETP